MIELIVLDAGHTLGVCTGPNTTDVLADLSPLSRDEVADQERRILHRNPLTEATISELCTVLHIDPTKWPLPWPQTGFEVYDYTPQALAELASIAKVVVLSNLDSASGPARIQALLDKCAPHIAAVWTSYGLCSRKPDPTLWRHLAKVYDADVRNVVHIGDNWVADVHGPTRAGCSAVYVETRLPAPPMWEWPNAAGRIAVAADLQHAVANVLALNEQLG